MRKKLLLASHNPGKCREFERAFQKLAEVELVSLSSLSLSNYSPPEETGSTYSENALIKARAATKVSGYASFADDSGFEVDALKGRPGVFSARYGSPDWSDEDRYLGLLKEMENEENRKARFVCVLALAIPGSHQEFLFEGRIEGELLQKPAGTKGFGYDPVFRPFSETKSFAELSLERKNEISHRARAIEAMIEKSPEWISFVP